MTNTLTARNPNSQRYVPDFIVSNFGTIGLLKPFTPEANKWIDAHVSYDPDWQWFGGALAVEPRYLRDLVAGVESDSLSVRLATN